LHEGRPLRKCSDHAQEKKIERKKKKKIGGKKKRKKGVSLTSNTHISINTHQIGMVK
jgi:hypothetical protein